MTPEQKQPAEATPVSERPARGYATPAATGRAVVVGLAADVPRALVHPAVGSAGPFVVAGVVTVSEDDENVREHAESLHHLLREHRAGVVLVAGPLGPETMRAVGDIAMLHGCRLLAVMPSEIIPGYEPMVVWEGASPLIQLSEFHRAKWQYRLKRLLDLVGSALGIVVLAPFFLLIALGIKLDTPGPALFEHWRVGRRGRGFHCLKFRTMRADAEEVLERNEELKALYRENHFKLPEQLDPRVTRVGRFLRRTSLDELPQLFNVLSGEMSLVVPTITPKFPPY